MTAQLLMKAGVVGKTAILATDLIELAFQALHAPQDVIRVWLQPAVILNQFWDIRCICSGHEERLTAEGQDSTSIVKLMT